MAKQSGIDYAGLAEGIDEIRETIRAVVAGLMDDGFNEEQARAITTGIFANLGRRKTDDDNRG